MKSISKYYKQVQKPSKYTKDVMILYNEYNDMAKVYSNGDVIIGKRKIVGKFKNKHEATMYLMKLGWLYD